MRRVQAEDTEASTEMIDDEGWFHTGNVVYYSEEWYFFVSSTRAPYSATLTESGVG